METKICTKCNFQRLISDFGKDKSKPGGLRPSCKECKREADRLWRIANAEKKKATDREYAKLHAVQQRAKTRQWVFDNPERHQINRQRWYDNNQDKIKASRERFKETNKQELRLYMNQYMKKRYHTNINYRVKSIAAARIRAGVKKDKSTIKYIGCSVEEFRGWIQSQFDTNMTWDNMGSYWHFDHVKPVASFDLTIEEEKSRCFHWSNLRPCEKFENIIKRDKIDLCLIAQHTKLAQSWSDSKMAYQS